MSVGDVNRYASLYGGMAFGRTERVQWLESSSNFVAKADDRRSVSGTAIKTGSAIVRLGQQYSEDRNPFDRRDRTCIVALGDGVKY